MKEQELISQLTQLCFGFKCAEVNKVICHLPSSWTVHEGGQWTAPCQFMLLSLTPGYHKLKEDSAEREKSTAGMGLESLLATG